MTAPILDYSDIVPLLPLNWEADEDAFRYMLESSMGLIVSDLAKDGTPLDTANIGALHEACWTYRARVLEHAK